VRGSTSRDTKKIHQLGDVDAYIDAAPKAVRVKLGQLRKIIKNAAPKAVERISYGMPYYEYKGRLVYFLGAKNHIGLYIPTPVVEEHRKELEQYETSKATIRFPLDQELPVALIRKLIKARIKKNENALRKK
jgi:uncharacterized protein YdhG (YjbR/CyaY superfamily)